MAKVLGMCLEDESHTIIFVQSGVWLKTSDLCSYKSRCSCITEDLKTKPPLHYGGQETDPIKQQGEFAP